MGTSVRESLTKEVEPRRPARITTTRTKLEEGRWSVRIQVLAENGMPAAEVCLRIIDQGNTVLDQKVPTDDKGVAEYVLPFQPGEEKRLLKIIVPGSEISINMKVFR